jgi:hypothetical protein
LAVHARYTKNPETRFYSPALARENTREEIEISVFAKGHEDIEQILPAISDQPGINR